VKPCKRVEVVIEQTVAARLADVLDRTGVSGYTVISGASGRGDRGARRNDDPTGTFTNCVFIIACNSDDEANEVVEAIRPLIKRAGGMCLVSDAMWVKH